MTIEELAKRKTELQQFLESISMCNIYGKKPDELVEINLQQIKAQKEMFDVARQIQDYIEGKAA